MLTSYIHAAMRLAKYEILENGTYYGEIPGFQGVWANADLLDTCREELQSALEDWLILGLRMGPLSQSSQGSTLHPLRHINASVWFHKAEGSNPHLEAGRV